MLEIKTKRTAHSRALAVAFAVTVQLAAIMMCFTAIWISITPDGRPAEVRAQNDAFSTTLRSLLYEVDPASAGRSRITGQVVLSGWPLENNALRLTSSCMIVLFGLTAFIIAPFVPVKHAYVGFLVWFALAFIFIVTAFGLDVSVLNDTFTTCQNTACPEAIGNGPACTCSFNPWYWVSIGFEAAFLLMLLLSIIGLVVGLVRGTPGIVTEEDMYLAEKAKTPEAYPEEEDLPYSNVYEADEDEEAYVPRELDDAGSSGNQYHHEADTPAEGNKTPSRTSSQDKIYAGEY
ncbi:hypothetical protein FVE85_4113 [Porphyridium purpureum]|uniref:Uncharacterized protein n=1 Tax=Porphyridium purpureum TaxID=35688 RepID=A0A5J4YS70_PORPP|nr:hypothetical protein FVE85_4113 [Porphyridium purpureum]|eukprot:POR4661..scf229_5